MLLQLFSQVGTRNAVWEARVVTQAPGILNQSANAFPVDDQRIEPVSPQLHGTGNAGRSAAYDGHRLILFHSVRQLVLLWLEALRTYRPC